MKCSAECAALVVMSIEGLAKQGFRRSVDQAQNCMYRNASGSSCAIGQLIMPSEYTPQFERRNFNDLYSHDMLPDRLLPLAERHPNPSPDAPYIGYVLQRAHDAEGHPAAVAQRLATLCDDIEMPRPAVLVDFLKETK